ncbi:TniQ family protein [Allomesorhizobium camelthorni]|uniref:TniQ family protein n=1 Tax=Allomesorhizobium camelthorni TaxID=475069 RepID=A0A6G4WHH1_9HYPH|nr:TniQ family protein [Mesorhizobium camelthorni]NGO54054.1 TniQ family protein [Mesorhizobium camelthorni]
MKGDRPLLEMAWRYPLEHRETASGFASRLAALNGRSLRKFLWEMAVRPRDLDRSEELAIQAVAILGEADLTDLSRYTPRPLDTRFWGIGNEKLGRLSINRTYFRFCPRCVSEDLRKYDGPVAARPWLRLEWTVGFFRSCTRHHVFFDVTQPARRPFQPFDFTETLSELLPALATRAESAETAPPSPFQDWIMNRLDGLRDSGNWLDDLELHAAAQFCEALGLSSLHEPKVRTTTLAPADWAAAADEGYRIVSKGEVSLRALLARLNEAQASTRGVWGPRDTYGYAYGLLQKTVDDPAYEKLRDAVRRFAIETMPLEPGMDVLGHVLADRKVHTIRTASKDSGAHALTIRKLFQRKGLANDGAGLMDHRVTVDADEISNVVKSLKSAMTTPQVEKLTGIPRLHLKEMISAGYLQTVADTSNRSYAKHRFSPAAVDELMDRLFLGAADVTEPDPRQMSVMAARQVATATVSQMLAFLFEQKLQWKGRLAGVDGYRSLLVDADEITRLVRTEQTKTGLTKDEVLDFIPGMGKASPQVFIDHDHLTMVEEFNPEARRVTKVVSRESAEEFRRTYVSLGELSGKSGLHHKRVRLLLRGVGIETSFDPDVFGCFFYSRADVQRGERESLQFWHYDKASAQKKARKQTGTNPT